MKKSPIAFIRYLKKQIPVKHRTDAEADFTYRNLHFIIDNFLKEYSEEEEFKSVGKLISETKEAFIIERMTIQQ